MRLKWNNMDTDEQVYVDDTTMNVKDLVNLDNIKTNNVAKLWGQFTADEISDSINKILSDAWAASAYSMVPAD